ncbi:Gfo/Idh/MocA family oxidoreductase [Oscillatoriales cyanobacterium LEGE 11467]|uniref:Gfo/Idh/MocA family oxidoreductase n=1 Tax=Zarconia navalis LEGE 11467 TaxID=1828826 RepID=A0A928VXW1_9CYAN|nr:Gfo/Idh/MocA family oxidoreductase [Zarconia navalis]MBE9040153.1 Gfo/Idh/MocA family oxidoreductase [Zarconia navalis LEGE 11467]
MKHPNSDSIVPSYNLTTPIRVGLVGTGYAAMRRAEAFGDDDRSQLVAVVGSDCLRTQEFAGSYSAEAIDSWEKLVRREDIDLVTICTVNCDHGTIARAALQEGKHVVVEYPLCLDPIEAEELVALATDSEKLLHVEHIELLGGLHRALLHSLPEIEPVSYTRYITISSKHPAPRRWSYQPEKLGFPLSAALSRIRRLTDCFGEVTRVSSRDRYWDAPEDDFFTACLCTAELTFASGAMADVVYGKGDAFGVRENRFEVHGAKGTLILTPKDGKIMRGDEIVPIEIAPRRGLFAKDTGMVLDRLLENKPLYTNVLDSVYALKVADAARQSAQTGQAVLHLDAALPSEDSQWIY